uniref:WSC domain-containing protein n=1 Tax=Macrostomum lignano TaxID=282301 RepID=A0A1I8J7I3_9PLAT
MRPSQRISGLALICLLLAKFHLAVARDYTRTYLGCYPDPDNKDLTGLTGVSALLGYTVKSWLAVQHSSMTFELCGSICSAGGFPYMGLQVRVECFCGWSYGNHGAPVEADCDMSCEGNSSQICGGDTSSSVFGLQYTSPNLFKRSARTYFSVTNLTSFYRNVTAVEKAQCLLQCINDCQAVLYNQQLSLCHLLKFVLLPTELNTTDGEFYIRC